MKKVLIVDDETIVRVTLRTMIRWEELGLCVAADCNSGFQALEYLNEHEVDLLITDVKMPEMSGIELLRRLRERQRLPLTLILSGYNEFELVREAFRLGAYDYVMKADLNAESLTRILNMIGEKHWGDSLKAGIPAQDTVQQKKEAFALPDWECCGVAVLEVENFKKQAQRFGEDLQETMEKPMLELANQIPRVHQRGKLMAVQPGYYLFYYHVTEPSLYRQEISGIVRQIQKLWKDYMNLETAAAVTEAGAAQDLKEAVKRGGELLMLAPLGGSVSLAAEWEQKQILQGMALARERYAKLLTSLYETNEPEFEREKRGFFQVLDAMEEEEAVLEALRVIALIALKFKEYEEDFYAVFPEEVNYYQKLAGLDSVRGLELWLNNYFRWEMDYLKNRVGGRQLDVMLRARRFIADNFTNPELTLRSVADYVGLNEKYFTTRFTKAVGCNFRDYVTEIRLEKAKRLMETTDLKIYEISDRIGYNNVEHFNRMFKKNYGLSPTDYKKNVIKT